MIKVKKFTFNPFQENTYIISNEKKECIIIDPGCSNLNEEKEINFYIENSNLSPKYLLNTHCHIDHILGNNFIKSNWDVKFNFFLFIQITAARINDYTFFFFITYYISVFLKRIECEFFYFDHNCFYTNILSYVYLFNSENICSY